MKYEKKIGCIPIENLEYLFLVIEKIDRILS